MISRIQNVSFAGAKQRVAKKVAKDFEEMYVSASSNLKGTVNEKKAARQLRDAELFTDKKTLVGRIASLTVAKKNILASDMQNIKPAQSLTPAEIAKMQGIADNGEPGAFDFFG